MRALFFLPLPLLLLACTGKEDSASSDAFEAGQFQFTTLAVDDQCLDGAMDTLFMPEGTAADFADPIELPALADLPKTYSISLQAPFTDMSVTVEQGASESQLEINGAEQTGIEFDAETYPGCQINAAIDVSLTITTPDELQGSATLATSSFDEPNCPAPAADPCNVLLTLSAVRL